MVENLEVIHHYPRIFVLVHALFEKSSTTDGNAKSKPKISFRDRVCLVIHRRA